MDARPIRTSSQTSSGDVADRERQRDRVWEIRFVWLLLFGVVALACYHFAYSRVDDTIRSKVVAMLAQKLPQHLVALDSAHLEHGRGLVLEGLHIGLPTAEGPRIVARIPRMILRGPMEIVGLARGHIPIEQIFVDSIDLSAWQTDDGECSIQTLASKDPLPVDVPPIDIRRGLIRFGQEKNDATKEIICHDLTVSIRSRTSSHAQPIEVNSNDTEQTFATSFPSTTFDDGITVQANLSSSYFDSLKMTFAMSRNKQRWALHGNLDQLTYSSQLTDRLPRQWMEPLKQLQGFAGRGTADFTIVKEDTTAVPRFEVQAKVTSGSLQDPKVPYPLESLSGMIFCRNDLIQLRHVTAKSGRATFRIESDIHGLKFGVPMTAKLSVTSLPLDDRLYGAMPPTIQDQWKKLNIAGEVDAEISVTFDGTQWIPAIDVHAKQGSVNADIFPYPIQDVRGDFVYRDGVLTTSELTGVANGQKLKGSLRLEKALPRWLVDFSVASEGPVVIDNTLLNALAPRGQGETSIQKFVRSLSPTGSVHIEKSRFVRTAANPDVVSKSIELSFYNGSIRYSDFRYPVFDVQGHVSVENSTILFERLKGRNDSARVQCEGSCQCVDGQVDQLRLDFDIANVPLEEELQAALPASIKHLWEHLRPSGVLDRVLVTLERHSSRSPMDLAVLIQEDGKVDLIGGRCVTMQPRSLPYLLNDVRCEISYRPGVVEIRRFGASHDSSQVRAEGTCRVNPDGTWSGLLSWMPTTRLVVDQSLLVSLPAYIRTPLASTEFRGPLGITGQTLIASHEQTGEPSVKAWDLQVEVEDGQLIGKSLASGIRGTLHVQGENRPDGPIAKGFMEIDSAAIRNIPLTKMTGPFGIIDSKLLFGRVASHIQVAPISQYMAIYMPPSDVVTASAVMPTKPIRNPLFSRNEVAHPASWPQKPNQYSTPRSIANPTDSEPGFWKSAALPTLDIHDDDLHAKTLSGTVHIHGTHPLIEGQTEIQLALEDADLQGFLADLGEGHATAKGRLWVQCKLNGSFTHSNTLGGNGKAWIRDANFFEMPIMLRLFRVLSIKLPDEGAFESADVDFRVDGDRVPIDRISLDGDVMSLRGSGWTNLRRELQLDLYAYVGRRSALAAVFGPLVSNNDNATMLQVEVTGTTDNPQFRRSFPLMGNTLQQVFPERFTGQSRE